MSRCCAVRNSLGAARISMKVYLLVCMLMSEILLYSVISDAIIQNYSGDSFISQDFISEIKKASFFMSLAASKSEFIL